VSGASTVGGIAGYSSAVIQDSIATGPVTGNDMVGGLVGEAYSLNSRVIKSRAEGSVTGTGAQVGGLIGNAAWHAVTLGSSAYGSVSGKSYVGGLIGNAAGDIAESSSFGTVTGETYVGGLIGYGTSFADFIEDSFTRSPVVGKNGVSGTQFLGGLAGFFHFTSTITRSYAAGSITGGSGVSGTIYKGALIGKIDGTSTMTASIWNSDTYPGLSDIGFFANTTTDYDEAGITSATTAQMTDPTYTVYKDLLWTFPTDWLEDTNAMNNGYPIPNTNITY
jgi:hypothetical protein